MHISIRPPERGKRETYAPRGGSCCRISPADVAAYVVGGLFERLIMSRNKYVKDYRLEPTVNEKGKIRTKAVYVGGEYDYDLDRETVRRSGRVLASASVLGWIAFVAALVPKTSVLRSLYFALPFAFCALPLFLVSETALFDARKEPPLEHRTADRLSAGIVFRSVLFLVFSAASVVGYAVSVIRNFRSAVPADIVAGVSSALLLVCAVAVFAVRKKFSTHPVGEEKQDGNN